MAGLAAPLRFDPFATVLVAVVAMTPAPPTPNRPPVIAAIPDAIVTAGELLSFYVQATDPQGGTLTFALQAGSPPGAAIDPNSGLFTWTTPPQ